MELINDGNSNHQAIGDPSKLACMKLLELHPASWLGQSNLIRLIIACLLITQRQLWNCIGMLSLNSFN